MVRYFCDLCEKKTNGTEVYYIPIKKKDYGFKKMQMHLCGDCCSKFDSLSHELATMDMTERLDKFVNEIEDECEDDWF